MTNEQLANRLMGQVQFNDALDETCRALMEEAAEKLRGEPAASTPVTGDAVAAVCARCGDKPEGVGSLNLTLSGLVAYGKDACDPSQGATRWHLIALVRQMLPHLEAALAQDRASQDS